MSIYKIGEVVKINDQGNDDFFGQVGIVKKIELGSDDISILYSVEFPTNDCPLRSMLVFLENELVVA
ncbi:MAG: hypothetical protein APF81_11085 [Desulfosporosinus sp. BRH_c37]|nr:MAG: hypothetical protein APF81_11085 [Desulfosporosinus sp. BRH_c37]